MKPRQVNLPEIVGKGYASFWSFRGRYRVVKGGRGSKKSCTAALWLIYHIMKYPLANALVARRYFNGHKDSTYAQLKWAMQRLGVAHLWQCSKSPMELVYRPTGQKILFRGLDDPMSITSITVDKGYLCWVWIEEAFQIMNEDDFNKLDMSIRGEVPEGYFKQITMTFNPWSDKHWLKRRFFDAQSADIMSMTTNYNCNEFLGDDDRAIFEDMRIRFPRRYSIEGMGNWGIAEGLVYDNWREFEFDKDEIIKSRPNIKALFGLDFGYTNSYTAFIAFLLDRKTREIFIFDEYYDRLKVNAEIAAEISKKGYCKEKITADCNESKSIEELRRAGIHRIRAARKGPDSVRFGIQILQGYQMFVHPRCSNTIMELSNYIWEVDREGNTLNKPRKEYDHLMDALRYGAEEVTRGGMEVFK